MDQLITPKRFYIGLFKSNIIDQMTIKTAIFISSAFIFLQTMIGIRLEYVERQFL